MGQAKPYYAKPTAQLGTSYTYSFLCAGCALLRIILQPANHYTQSVPARAEQALCYNCLKMAALIATKSPSINK